MTVHERILANSAELQKFQTLTRFGKLEQNQRNLLNLEVANKTGFEMRHLEANFRKSKVDKILKQFSHIDYKKTTSIFLSGPVQTGKTSLLACMLKHQFSTWAEKIDIPAYRLPVYFAKSVILLNHEELKTIFSEDLWHGDESEIVYSMSDVCEIRHLIIDDLFSGNEKPNSTLLNKLWQLIDLRWRCGTRTWVTCNLSKTDLTTNFPDYERICSRLFHDNKWMLYTEVF